MALKKANSGKNHEYRARPTPAEPARPAKLEPLRPIAILRRAATRRTALEHRGSLRASAISARAHLAAP